MSPQQACSAFRFTLGLAVSLSCLTALAQEPGYFDPSSQDTKRRTSIVVEPESSQSLDEPQVEVVLQRYSNRKVEIERHVVQDSEGNYVNDGMWTKWNQNGVLQARGEYRDGRRDGIWLRRFSSGELKLGKGHNFRQFQAPFLAEANFVDGQLHGDWIIIDAKKRHVSQWQFDHGKRSGKWIWWYSSGKKFREVDYLDGELDGEWLEWEVDGVVARRDHYRKGRRHAKYAREYDRGIKQVEGWFLYGRENIEYTNNFWRGATVAKVLGKDGPDKKHGVWTWWYRNGGKALEGNFVEDLPVGKFTWWHSNGQRSAEGEYVEGDQQGLWTWWHANGQKSLQGIYQDGGQSGRWSEWGEDGKLVEVQEHTGDESDGPAPLVTSGPAPLQPLDGVSDDPGPTLQATRPDDSDLNR